MNRRSFLRLTAIAPVAAAGAMAIGIHPGSASAARHAPGVSAALAPGERWFTSTVPYAKTLRVLDEVRWVQPHPEDDDYVVYTRVRWPCPASPASSTETS